MIDWETIRKRLLDNQQTTLEYFEEVKDEFKKSI